MADRQIQRACERLKKELLPKDAELIQSTTSLKDVTNAIKQVEDELAARRSLRNLQRITPFVDAIDRYSKAIEVAANGTPYLSWLWAPLKIILQGVYDCTHALDKILMAYGQIGSNMPRLARYTNAFLQHPDFQQLLAFLFEDIIEFHTKAYLMICKPGWKIYFTSSWGLFEHRFGGLLQNITHTSELIDKEAVSLNIAQEAEQRQRHLDASISHETQWKTQQRQSVLNWFGTGESDPELKLEWLRDRCCEGTSQWITKSSKLRSWLQRGRGPRLLWFYGKPGSGKSVLSSQIIYFLRSDPARHVLFFFCDFHTPATGATTYILKSVCSQIVTMSSELVLFVYNDYVSKGRKLVTSTLRELLTQLLAHFEDVRLVINGIDELPQHEHRTLLTTIRGVTESSPTCKTLISSQDIPSIASSLSKKQSMCISEEGFRIREDMKIVIDHSLREINDRQGGVIEDSVLQDLKSKILEKAEGMFLWVRLVLDLIGTAMSIQDLRLQLNSFPKDLIEAYEKILDNIRDRCSDAEVMRMRRAFSWLLCQRGKHPLRKHHVTLGVGIYPGCHVLTKDTRPFPNTTDICKPFIEDGPGGSLVFIHSTVPQFLVEQSQTPFINLSHSQRIIAFACVAQLNQALDLFSEGVMLSEQCLQIYLGIYGLLPYAIEHWTRHLNECGETEIWAYDELAQQLRSLYQKLMRSGSTQLNENLEEKETVMGSEIQEFISGLVRTRTDGKEPKESTDGIYALSQILFKYHIIVQHIIKKGSIKKGPLTGGCQSDLTRFQEDYGPIAFVCQKAGCDRALIGFSSEGQLRDHADRHSQSLWCYEKGCVYNDVGFTAQGSLKNHKRKFHPTDEPKAIPKRINSTGWPITREEPTADPNSLSGDLNNNNNSILTNIPEFSEIKSGDELPDFDFDSFVHDDDIDGAGFNFNAATFMEGLAEIDK